jgi:putative sterol carrier protein
MHSSNRISRFSIVLATLLLMSLATGPVFATNVIMQTPFGDVEIELFDEQVPEALKHNPEKAKEVNAIYCFKIEGEGGGVWTVDLTSDPPTCATEVGDNAQCTIEVSHEDFMTMLSDPQAGMQLYFQGKLKVTGDPMLATKLQEFFKLAADEAGAE